MKPNDIIVVAAIVVSCVIGFGLAWLGSRENRE